jgi:hypothetical protein
MDCFFPGEGCHTSSTQVSFGVLVPGEGPRGHEFFYHAIVLELVLDRVCMVRVGLLEESLDVVYRRPRLALDTMRGGRDVLLIEVIHFLVVIIIIIAGRSYDPLGVPLWPLLSTLGRSTSTGGRSPTTWDKERSDRLLIIGVQGRDVDQLIGGVLDNVIWGLEWCHACRTQTPLALVS